MSTADMNWEERAKALGKLRRLITEENADTWDYDRPDDVRSVLLSGNRVTVEVLNERFGPWEVKGENGEMRTVVERREVKERAPVERYYTGGNWEWFDEDKANAEGWRRPKGKRADKIAGLLKELTADELTELALSLSLCPLHLVDYAICFDDGDPECAAIRLVWPGHDT